MKPGSSNPLPPAEVQLPPHVQRDTSLSLDTKKLAGPVGADVGVAVGARVGRAVGVAVGAWVGRAVVVAVGT